MAALRNDAPHITCGVSRDLPLRSPPDSFVQSRGHENSPKALQAHSRPSEFDRITNHLILRDYMITVVFFWHWFLQERIILSCFWQALSILETLKLGDSDNFLDSTMYRPIGYPGSSPVFRLNHEQRRTNRPALLHACKNASILSKIS